MAGKNPNEHGEAPNQQQKAMEDLLMAAGFDAGIFNLRLRSHRERREFHDRIIRVRLADYDQETRVLNSGTSHPARATLEIRAAGRRSI